MPPMPCPAGGRRCPCVVAWIKRVRSEASRTGWSSDRSAGDVELAAADQQPWYKQPGARRFSRSATGLSADYQALVNEILGRYISLTDRAATA